MHNSKKASKSLDVIKKSIEETKIKDRENYQKNVRAKINAWFQLAGIIIIMIVLGLLF